MEREQADDEDGREVRASMAAYYSCLRDNPHYRALWIADVIDNTGAWLNYVATLELMTSFSPSSLALSAVVLIRFIPSLLLSPLAGVLADSCNRVTVLVVAALVDALAVAALATVHQASQAPLLFALLAAQFAAIALQDPSRKAIVPALVPREQLHLAATLETFSWSLTGALGAGLGGLIASRLGNATCFLMDAATYLLAAWCLHKVPRELGDPGALERRAPRKRPPPGGSGVEMAAQPPGGAAPDVALDVEAAPLLAPAQPPAAAAAAAPAAAPAGGLAAAAAAACAEGVRSLREGWAYLLHRENRDVAALVLMKGCGSITWGAVDILNVK
jgi:MFS family permease